MENELKKNLKDLKIDQIWRKGHEGKNVKVAIIDTYADVKHPMLIDRFTLKGWTIPNTNQNHGTEVAKIIAGAPYQENKGIAPKTTGVVVECFETIKQAEGFSKSNVIGQEEKISLESEGDSPFIQESLLVAPEVISDALDIIGADVDIVNMSMHLAEEMYRQQLCILEANIRELYQKGMIFIAAAGNEGSDGVNFPARMKEVIAVGGYNDKGERHAQSNYGPELDILAPGNYGTSFACAYVSGVAALFLSKWKTMDSYPVHKTKTPIIFKNLLKATGTPTSNDENASARRENYKKINPLALINAMDTFGFPEKHLHAT